jgi:hypothetical protein
MNEETQDNQVMLDTPDLKITRNYPSPEARHEDRAVFVRATRSDRRYSIGDHFVLLFSPDEARAAARALVEAADSHDAAVAEAEAKAAAVAEAARQRSFADATAHLRPGAVIFWPLAEVHWTKNSRGGWNYYNGDPVPEDYPGDYTAKDFEALCVVLFEGVPA